MASNQARERATHPKPTVLSDFILGSQDGIVNVLGIILGLSAATRDVRIILVATLAALGAESIAMGAVAYTSTRARRRLYLSQAVQERREMKEIPQTERDEVREILTGWGYQGADLEEIVERIWPQPDRGARIHDVLRTQALPRRGGRSECKRLSPPGRARRGAFAPPLRLLFLPVCPVSGSRPSCPPARSSLV